MLIPELVGERLDDCKTDAIELLLRFSKENYRDYGVLASERINLLEAAATAFRTEQWISIVDYALVLDAFLDTQGYWEEDARNLKMALEAVKRLGPGYEKRKALALHDLAVIYLAQGDDERAQAYFDQSLALQRQLGDKLAVSRAIHYLGRIHAKAKRRKLAHQFLKQSLTLGQEAGDDRGVSATLHELGTLCLSEGDLAQAEDYYQRSLTISQNLDIARETAATLHQLGMLSHRRGDMDRARGFFEESLQMRYQAGHLEGIADSLYSLGNIASEGKLLDQARQQWQESLRIFERLGMPIAQTVRAKLSMFAETPRRGQDE
jgi:tetratricopeptide (TPR) repeat protein